MLLLGRRGQCWGCLCRGLLMLKGSSLPPFAVHGAVLKASLSSSCNEFSLAGQCPHCLGSPGASVCNVCRLDFLEGRNRQTHLPQNILMCISNRWNCKKLKKSLGVRKWSKVKRQKILPTWLLGLAGMAAGVYYFVWLFHQFFYV